MTAVLLERFKNKIIPTIILLLLLGFSSWSYLFPKQYDYQDNAYYATNLATTTVQNEYMPKWVKNAPTAYSQQKIFIVSSTGIVDNIIQKGTQLSFTITLNRESIVQVGYVYFPGWRATVEGKQVKVVPSASNGLVEFNVPSGKHTVVVRYVETMLQLFADMVTIVSFGVALLIFVKNTYEK